MRGVIQPKGIRRLKRVIGYFISIIPLIISMVIVIRYRYFVPQPIHPTNQTLQGTEIFFPILLGVILSLIFGVQIPFRKVNVRKELAIWTSLAILPLILLVLFLYVPYWAAKIGAV